MDFTPVEVDLGGAILPSKCCPHILDSYDSATIQAAFSQLPEGLTVVPCHDCSSTKENWMCLSCGLVSCSRYQNCHGESHWLEHMCSANEKESSDTHCLSISFSDLNVWCYECGSYIKHSSLIPLLVEAEAIKFTSAPKQQLLEHSRHRTGYHTAVTLPTARMDAHKVEDSTSTSASPSCDERPLRTTRITDKLNGADSNTLCDVMTVNTSATAANTSKVMDAIYLVHTPEMVEDVRLASADASATTTTTTTDLYFSSGTFNAAVDAVACCIAMVDAIFARNADADADGGKGKGNDSSNIVAANIGQILRGLCIVRPPGHHSTRSSPGGFCIFNNVAIAASYAKKMYLDAPLSLGQPAQGKADREEVLRKTLTTFYGTYAPEEVGKVNNLVQRVVGGPPSEVGGIVVGGVLWTEEELFAKLEDKYGGKVICSSTDTSTSISTNTGSSGKLLIVDLDNHHGNGTQDIFYEDPNVVTLSIHRQMWMLGSSDAEGVGSETVELPIEGRLEYMGAGAGIGCNINIPLRNISSDTASQPKAHGDADYAYIFNELVLPVVDSVKPDLVLVALGFDASMYDSSRNQGGYLLSSQIYNNMMQALSYRTDHGRVLATLEGGYDVNGLAVNVDSVLKALSSIDVGSSGQSSPRVFADSVDRATGVIACDHKLVLESTIEVVNEVKNAFSESGYFD